MRLPVILILVTVVGVSHASIESASFEARISLDAAGNAVITSAAGRDIITNGIRFQQLAELPSRLQSLEETLEQLKATCSGTTLASSDFEAATTTHPPASTPSTTTPSLIITPPAPFSPATGFLGLDEDRNLVITAPQGRDIIFNNGNLTFLVRLAAEVNQLQDMVDRLQQACVGEQPSSASTTSTTSTAQFIAPQPSVPTTHTALMTIDTSAPSQALPTTPMLPPPLLCQPLNVSTIGARSIDTITVNGSTYLAVANSANAAVRNLNSSVYAWNATASTFALFQSIPTQGAITARFFLIPPRVFLMFVNENNGTSYTVSCQILVLDPKTSRFVDFQLIPVLGGWGAAAFQLPIGHFIVLGSSYDGKFYNMSSQVLRFNSSSDQFEPFQMLNISAARAIEHFVMNGTTYLAVASYRSATSFDTMSFVYEFNNTLAKFTLFQNLRTHSCIHLKPFAFGTNQFLAAANYKNSTSNSYQLSSEIFLYNSETNRFVSHQLLQTVGATGFEAIVANSNLHLFVSSFYDGSKFTTTSSLLKWNTSALLLDPVLSIPTNGPGYPHSFTIDADLYLAVPYYEGNQTYKLNSQVFRWCG